MVIDDDIVKVRIVEQDWTIVSHFAKTATIGGKSEIRTDPNERSQNVSLDNLIGQLGTLALSKYWTGSYKEYVLGRHMQDRFPNVGDCGEDIMGLNLDVKTTHRKNPNKAELTYNLAIRDKEYHPNHVYVLALVDSWPEGDRPKFVSLIGWAKTGHLPKNKTIGGIFDGAYTIEANDLNPLPPVKWAWLK